MMSCCQNVRERLSKVVCEETFHDIEDYLAPRFDFNTMVQIDKPRPSRKIVRDGHGIWREVKPHSHREEQKHRAQTKRYSRHSQECPASLTPRDHRDNVNNELYQKTVRGSGLNSPQSRSQEGIKDNKSSFNLQTTPRKDYSALSITTRSNVFPGVGNQDWHSQSTLAHTQSALRLGQRSGRDLGGDQFYGLTRDAMGAWNEASVLHERMKKSWDAFIASRGSGKADK